MGIWATFFSTKKETTPPPALESLRVQVYRRDCISMQVVEKNSPGVFARRPLAHGLIEVLVEQRADGEAPLRWDVARTYGKPDDELFAIAAAQGAATTNVKSTDYDGVQLIASNEFYLSSLLLQSFARGNHKHGVLFAPISWHHWCVHVVQAATLPPTVAMMMLLTREAQQLMHVADYEALTSDLYWYKPGGVIEKLELVGTGAEVRATSSELEQAMTDAFQSVMRR